MSVLSRPGLAHRLYEALGVLTVIEDHLENSTAIFPAAMDGKLAPLVLESIDLLKHIVCDRYFALGKRSEEAAFELRLTTNIGSDAFARLNSWADELFAALTHVTRVMRIADMPQESGAPVVAGDPVQNRKKMLISLIEGDEVCAGYPMEIDVQQANGCNLRCRHCYQSADQDFPLLTFGVGLAKRLMESPLLGSVSKVYLAGRGEPTMSQASALILSAVPENGQCEKSIATNGTLPSALRSIAPLLTSGVVSFDGGSAETFEAIRAGADYEKVIRNIESLAPENRARLTFNHALTRLSIREAPDLVRLSAKLGMRGVNFNPLVAHEYLPVLRRLQFIPSDREIYEASIAEAKAVATELGVKVTAGNFDNIVTVDESEARAPEEIKTELAAIEPAAYLKPASDPCLELRRLLDDKASVAFLVGVFDALPWPDEDMESANSGDEQDELKTVLPACGWPWTTAYLEADGSIVPCCGPMNRTPMGNLRYQTFDEIWNGPAYRRLRRQQVTGEAFFQGCVDCTRGMKFMHLQKACVEILANPEKFQGRTFINAIPVPSHIANLGVVKKVLGANG